MTDDARRSRAAARDGAFPLEVRRAGRGRGT